MNQATLRRYPPRAARATLPNGVDLANTLLEVAPGYAQKLDEYEYGQDTLRRRKPFVALRLGSGAELTTDYTSRGAFGLAFEYVDSAGQTRLLHAHADGTIQELDRQGGTDTQRVSGLTISKVVRFESYMGACVACNGTDAPRRGDDATWRTFGAPVAVSGLTATPSGTGLTGVYQWIVVPVIEVSGVVAVRGDWSNIATATLANQGSNLAWTASPDTRVTGYEIYRSFAGLGYPYYLVTKVSGRTTVTYSDTTTDANLSGQSADPIGQNGSAPIARYVTVAGRRLAFGSLVDATDPDASKSIWLSIVATNKYEVEIFPKDGQHRFRLPGKGDLTCIKGIGNKDSADVANDLFLAQLDSCYLLRGTDPKAALETISAEVGVLNQEAFTQWGRFAFFVSLRGLEFLGPSGAPLLLSKLVGCVFAGGGEAGYLGNQGNQHITCRVTDSVLLVTTRQDSGKLCADLTLVMDLASFRPYDPDPARSARFTIWKGPWAFYLWTRDRALLAFDNQNFRILQRGAGAYDHLAGVPAAIQDEIWSGPVLAELPDFRKTLSICEVLQISDAPSSIIWEGDYGAVTSAGTLSSVSPTFTSRLWDKTWDKQWVGNTSYGASLALGRNLNADVFQFKLKARNSSADFAFLGFILHYRQVIARIFGKR